MAFKLLKLRKSTDDLYRLHKLCRDGNFTTIKTFIEGLSDDELAKKLKTKTGSSGYTPLHEAASSGGAEVLDYILTKAGNTYVNSKAAKGFTPLHVAAGGGHRDCVVTLLKHGADITLTDDFGKTALKTAELSSKGSVVRLLRSEELIKEVETNGNRITDLLRNADRLEPNCFPRALIAATHNDSHHNIAKLSIKGAPNLDECIEIATVENKPHSRAMLLLIKAGITGDLSIVARLFGEQVTDGGSLDPGDEDVREAVLSGKISTVVPIEIARRNGNSRVREELLLKTDINIEEGSVFWHSLRLLTLDVGWLKRISWVKRLRLARNGFRSLPDEMGGYLKQVVKLDLQHNDLAHIPRCLLELPSLEELHLGNNQLVEIPEEVTKWSPSLRVLDLSHNRLSYLPENISAPLILTLNLSFNEFREVPHCVCSFVTLHSLDLGENLDIIQLPFELGNLIQLSHLGLSGLKYITDPPRHILKDTQACIRYLNSKLHRTNS